jgi:type IV secretory pathway TrbF-like protein
MGSTEGINRNPYFEARRRWNEVIGSTVQRARIMTLLTIILAIGNAALIGGMWHLASMSKVVPYVMVLNEAMTPVSMGVAQQGNVSDKQTITRSFLARFIVDLRTITADASLLNKQFERLYTMLLPGTESYSEISTHFRESSPFSRAAREVVAVNVVSLLPTSESAWEAEWVEVVTTRGNGQKTKRTYRAVLNIGQATEQDSKAMLHNPLGVVVERFEYTEKLI